MNIFINNNKYQIAQLGKYREENPSYRKLMTFIIDWFDGKQIFNFQTSGSTGQPKEIQITKSQILSSVKATKEALNLKPTDQVLICLNPDYIATTMMVARCLILEMDMHIIAPSSNPFEQISPKTKIDFASFQLYHLHLNVVISLLLLLNHS